MTITGKPEEIAKFMVATQEQGRRTASPCEIAFLRERKKMWDEIYQRESNSTLPPKEM